MGKKRLIPHTIQGTLLLVLVVVLLPVLMLEPVLHYLRFETRRDQELAANLELARLAGSSFEAYVEDILRQEILIGVALTSAPVVPVEQANRLLMAGANERSSIGYYSWVDPTGHIVASSDLDSIGTHVGDERYFREIAGGQEWVVSNLQQARPAGEPVFIVARGVRDDFGVALLGAVVALVDARHLSEVLQVDRAEGGSITIIDPRGYDVYDFPSSDLGAVPASDLVALALNGREGTGTYLAQHGGERRMGAFTPIKRFGWVAGASRPSTAASSEILGEFLREFALYLLVGVGGLLVALAIGRKLTVPLLRLRDNTRALGMGEHTRRTPVDGPIELRELASTFNKMADAVEARTRELGLMYDVVHSVAEARDLDAALYDLAERLAKAIDVPVCRVAMLASGGQRLVVRASFRDGHQRQEMHGRSFAVDDVPPARQVIERKHEVVEVSGKDSHLLSEAERERWQSAGLNCGLGVPLLVEDRVIGLLTLGDNKRRQFSAEEKRLCLAVAQQTASVIEKASLSQQIEAERQRLDAIVQNASDGIIVLDDQMRVTRMNPAMEGLSGFSPDEVLGRPCREVLRSSDQAGSSICDSRCPMLRAMKSGRPVPYVEIVVVAKDGTVRELSTSYTYVRLSRADAGYGVVVARDITQMKAVEKLKDEFVSLLSHDLKQPLAVIKGFAEIVHQRLVKSGAQPDTARYAEQIVSGSRRLEAMIADLVDSARLESGRLTLRTQSVDLAEVVAAAVRVRIPAVERARVRVEPPDGRVCVSADGERLERVVANLIGNALKYSPDEEPVVVRVMPDEGQAVVSVEDRGVGVSEEDLPKLFDRFYRAQSGRRRDGLGLGLYISKMLVEAHGGRIWAESVAGEGSKFSFSLPVTQGQPGDQATPVPPKDSRTEASVG